jgi:hypothetical protein
MLHSIFYKYGRTIMTTPASPERYSAYQKISKEGAAQCQIAHRAAHQQYDRELEPHRKAINAAYGKPDYRQAMATLDKRRDVALAKADKIYAALMKDAWEKAFQGKPEEIEQLALWAEEVQR